MNASHEDVAAVALAAQGVAGGPTPEDLEKEVLDNVRHQPLGAGTVEDLAMPEDFLRRVADRIVRASYEERYRIVVEEPSKPAVGGAPPMWSSPFALFAGGLAVACIAWIVVARRKERSAR